MEPLWEWSCSSTEGKQVCTAMVLCLELKVAEFFEHASSWQDIKQPACMLVLASHS
jgi:hypothetical protein